MNLRKYLDQSITKTLAACLPDGNAPAVVKPAGKPEFGHYQANGIMGAAKKNKLNPRDLAAQVVEKLATNPELGNKLSLEIAGPGFINLRLTEEFLTNALVDMSKDERLGVPEADQQITLVDYSSPNLAKELHIGHLRSTAIGDTAVRILEFLGHDVIRANHVGDWGAQFGSLLAYMDQLESDGQTLALALKDLEAFYQEASAMFKSDEAFATRAREFVVRLQQGDEKCLALWQRFIDESIAHCQAVYDALDISLTPADVRAESAYNSELADVISDLESKGMVTIDNSAKCVFLPEFTGKDDKMVPAIVQKSDGGYPYIATDLAAARYRGQELGVNAALYFVDGRQSLHLSQLYAVAKAAGYISDDQDFRHVAFGTILNKEGKPFKTRDGGAVKLADVVTEAVSRAETLVSEKADELNEAERAEIARVVGVGAIKYAELSKNRTTDYIFDWDTMLSFEGNTAPYLQYAYTRIMSIFRRAGLAPEDLTGDIALDGPAEIDLALKLLQYPEAVEAVTDDYQANILCNYLFELAGQFMTFYEQCPVLKADEAVMASRLQLCALSARTLQHGLGLLGISTVEKM